MGGCMSGYMFHLQTYSTDFAIRWEDNIRMDLREIGWGNVDWIHLTQDRNQWRTLVNKVMYPRVP